ncbi:SdpI family protein [Desulfosporosinus meridiei]|uniref:SdpI family protein n=1 Tax=Desulfosporosinus meridiei TaxID=79209 RepID=UPI0011D23E9E|nr:SdpI family protein [Desulfosporosinus meridiei]
MGSRDSTGSRSTLQENASRDAVWRKAHSFAAKVSFGAGGSAILSTGHYRAFRSRADDTWGIAPGKVGSTLQEYASRDAVWRKARPPFVSPGKQAKDHL